MASLLPRFLTPRSSSQEREKMKFLFAVGLLSLIVASTTGLRCWTCDNARTNAECIENGHLKTCVEKDAICEDQIRHEQYGEIIMIEKRCKQEHACDNNVNQNGRQAYPIQCNTKSMTSVCRCCCKGDGCNRDLMTCWNNMTQYLPPDQARCYRRPDPPQHGNMQCYGNLEPGTYCKFHCHDGFFLMGAETVTCQKDRFWDNPPPKCQRLTCPPARTAPGNGSVTCTDGIYLDSNCRYSCRSDYQLVGASSTVCRDVDRNDGTGDWSKPMPFCKPINCPVQGPLRHGKISCSKGRKINSVCRFICDTDYQLYPPFATAPSLTGISNEWSNNQCVGDGVWNRGLPCCSLPCPPFAVMDFVVVLDSSSSVGPDNWVKMKSFVRSFLDDFTVRDDSTHFSIVRYNKIVDTETQILFNDYPNDIRPLLTAYDKIPYDGSGTRTGNALNHTADVLLKVGNRLAARDVVLLITDGASQDDVLIPAKRVRDTGALMFVLPVLPPVGRLDMDEINAIAGPGNEANVLTDALERGFDALDEEFAAKISKLLCGSPCDENPLHEEGQ